MTWARPSSREPGRLAACPPAPPPAAPQPVRWRASSLLLAQGSPDASSRSVLRSGRQGRGVGGQRVESRYLPCRAVAAACLQAQTPHQPNPPAHLGCGHRHCVGAVNRSGGGGLRAPACGDAITRLCSQATRAHASLLPLARGAQARESSPICDRPTGRGGHPLRPGPARCQLPAPHPKPDVAGAAGAAPRGAPKQGGGQGCTSRGLSGHRCEQAQGAAPRLCGSDGRAKCGV